MDVPNFSNRCLDEKGLAPGIAKHVKTVSEELNKEIYKNPANVFWFGVMMKSSSVVWVRSSRASQVPVAGFVVCHERGAG